MTRTQFLKEIKFVPGYNSLTKDETIQWTKYLTDFAKRFLNDEYGIELKIPITIYDNCQDLLALFTWKNNPIVPHSIIFNSTELAASQHDNNKEQAKIIINNILKHELVHYALCVLNKPFDDGTLEFEKELARLDIPSSFATNQELRLTKNTPSFYAFHFKNKENIKNRIGVYLVNN